MPAIQAQGQAAPREAALLGQATLPMHSRTARRFTTPLMQDPMACVVCSSGAEKGLWPNAWVLACALFACTPVIAAQSVLAWLGAFFPRRQWELHSHAAARYFLSPYILVPAGQCGVANAQAGQL